MIFFISDIHLGVKLPFEDFDKSLDEIFKLIKEHEEPCKAIMVCGDLFDHHLSIEEFMYAAKFVIKLVLNNCGRDGVKHVPVHIVEGTFSHDRKQMKIFMPILNEINTAQVYYYENATSVKLSDGTKILFLPQEYGNVDYSDLFNDKYDLIIGHGPISSHTKTVVESHGTEIMHSVEQLGDMSKLCVFGHYHEYTDFGNGVYYTGSLLRFRYGEDTDKVFFMCDDKYNVTTVKNPFAKEFKTFEINTPDELRDALSNDIDTPHRFVIHPKNDDELNTYHAIMNVNKLNQNVKFKVDTSEQVEDVVKAVESHDVDNATNMDEPIPSLIAYINEKYDINTEKEIREYEARINKEV